MHWITDTEPEIKSKGGVFIRSAESPVIGHRKSGNHGNVHIYKGMNERACDGEVMLDWRWDEMLIRSNCL